MSFDTCTSIINGYYGEEKIKKDGTTYFKKHGKAVTLDEIIESIEDDRVHLKLSSDYLGRKKVCYIERGELLEVKTAKKLVDIGCDVTRNHFDSFVDSIRLQEDEMDENNTYPTPGYQHLGWIQLPDDNGVSLYYRAHRLIGYAHAPKYIGTYYIEPLGDYEVWKEMVLEDVIPYPTLQLVLIAALSAVVVGLLSISNPIENPIVHLNLPSSQGKTTAGYLAASTVGCPFEGKKTVVDDDGRITEMQSIYQSWGATDNAMIATQAGNRGAVVVLNELGKSLTNNMTRIIFDLSEGSDKNRLDTNLNSRTSKGYSTTFISTGESSLLEKCKTKQEGLAIRVMEITSKLTKDADHSNRIKKTCCEHCGFAAPLLAQYIIDNGGEQYVLEKYNQHLKAIRESSANAFNSHRFAEKFSALFLTTADIATKALEINFDIDGLRDYLREYNDEQSPKRNTAAKSYDALLDYCRIYTNKFYIQHAKSYPGKTPPTMLDSVPLQDSWGRITNMAIPQSDGSVLVREYDVCPRIVEGFLKQNGYESLQTCISAWKAAGVLNYEDDQHPKRARKIDPFAKKGTTERVYVFREFATGDDAKAVLDEIEKDTKSTQRRRSGISSTSISLLDDVGGSANA